MYYILVDQKPVEVSDVLTWGEWFENADRHVAQTAVRGVRISTVFLGVDHSFGDGPPMLFETMVFGGPMDEEMARYSTWEEAEAGHKEMVQEVKKRGIL